MQESPLFPLQTRPKSRTPFYVAALAIVLILASGGWAYWYATRWTPVVETPVEVPVVATSTPVLPPPVVHVPMPDEVRGIYVNGDSAGTKRLDELADYAVASHLNTLVIDLKLDNGELTFVPNDPALKENAPENPAVKDLDASLERLRAKGIYRIARIFIFRDGAFGKRHPNIVLRTTGGGIWRDNLGTPWLDPAAPEVADYAIALAREAYTRGFDEVQFDYIRFPTDGRLATIRYPVYDGTKTRVETMKAFFDRVGGALHQDGIPVSFDLFGMTFWTLADFDIGQRLPDVYPYAVAVSPMVYPSHYPTGFQGFTNPALYPYEIVKRSLDKGIETLRTEQPDVVPAEAQKKFRPWIQDFNMGATYDAAKVEAQIKAARDAHAGGWMIWNAGNKYTKAAYVK